MNSNNIFQDKTFSTLLQTHAYEILKSLKQSDTTFSIIVSTEFISFTPALPKNIKATFDDIALFDIGGYAQESLEVLPDRVIFETGFGKENFGSVLDIPMYAVAQIIVEKLPIFTNPIEPTKEQNSKNIFLSNPKNKHLF